MIDKSVVMRVLRCPNAELLRYALSFASLSKKEEVCLTETIIRGETEESAAENLGISVDTLARYKRSAIERLRVAWEFCPIIPYLSSI